MQRCIVAFINRTDHNKKKKQKIVFFFHGLEK